MSKAGVTLWWTAVGMLVWAVAPAAPARIEVPDTVLVTVNGEVRVTVADFVVRFVREHPSLPADSLTPVRVAQFLEVLADDAALLEAAARARIPWTPADSAEHEAFRDRLVMRAALGAVLLETRAIAHLDSAGAEALGLAARDRIVANLAPVYDDSLVARLARAWSALPRPSPDSSLEAQVRQLGVLPAVSPGDTGRVVARSAAGDVRVSELLRGWARLSVAYRPRIDTPEHVRDLVGNVLFERTLRERAAAVEPDSVPAMRAALRAHAERLTLSRWLDREVLAGLEPKPRELESWFAARESLWALPVRARVVRLVFDDKAAAHAMALTLRDAAQAESLVARAKRAGVDYRVVVTASSDSGLFREATRSGAGTVVGPTKTDEGFRVARVEELLAARRRSLDDVRREVERAWRSQEAERRTRALAARLRKTLHVAVYTERIPRVTADLRQAHGPNQAQGEP